MADLTDRALVCSEYGAKNALANIINAFGTSGRIRIDKEVQTPGFFLVDGRLTAYHMDLGEHTVEELTESALFLNELVAKHHRKEIPATTLKWGMIAAFDFALKQYTEDICWIPWLGLADFPRAGKGTQGRIASGLWSPYGSNKYSVPYTSVNTEARLAKKLSLNTIPMSINEIRTLGDERNSNMLEMFKTSIETRISRSKYADKTLYVDELALRPAILTSNWAFPTDTGFRSKIIYIIYTKEDKYWTEEQKKQFDAFMYRGRKHLRTLGDFTGRYILEHQNVLLKENREECDWKETSQRVLEEFYTAANVPIPVWVHQFVEETEVTTIAIEEAEQTKYFELRGFIRSAVIENYRLDPIPNEESPRGEVSFQQKLDRCLNIGLIPYLHNHGGSKKHISEVAITHDVINHLKKAKVSNITTMDGLAKEIPGFGYDCLWMNGQSKRVVHGSYAEFIKFLDCEFADG
jgi:hypothetical protein